ncbi:MAG TPA: hypothetical protein VMI56_12635 [Reyranella sp.]|nr:hypothetical protein [Reyranella sp.]
MLELTIGVFRTVGGLIFFLVVIGSALQGLAIGRLLDYGTRSSAGAIIGFLVGGGVGFVVASWIFGIVHLLISLNDQSEKMVVLQQRLLEVLERAYPRSSANTSVSELHEAVAGVADTPSVSEVNPESWRQRFLLLPVDQSLEVNGLVVWKLQEPGGKIYFSGDRIYYSLDELLGSYKIT